MAAKQSQDAMRDAGIRRKKRENCKFTKHDRFFSQWEVLVGPYDWENFSLGKNGVERYRIHNLPISCSCPGLYELGIAACPTDVGREIRKLDPTHIIVVYLGQADNVRTRLQHYGRAGSHLDQGNTIGLSNENVSTSLERGPGLFREIFSRGFPIVFRWVPMKNKKEAEKAEAQLLGFFDYAWNKGGNGARRRDDILLILDGIASGTPRSDLLAKLAHWYWRVFSKKCEGIRINSSIPSKGNETASDLKHNLAWRLFKFSRNRPQMVPGSDVDGNDHAICGVSLGDGSVCRSRPVGGRKRCDKHRGKRINGPISKSLIACERTAQGETGVCVPVKCLVDEDSNICGVLLGDGSVCQSKPIEGIKRCGEHKGKRISRLIVRSVILGGAGDCTQVEGHINVHDAVCGVLLPDRSVCKSRPVKGRKRCVEHRAMRINGPISWIINERKSSICGFKLEDGSVCGDSPVHGRKRCEVHKGRRVMPINQLLGG